MNTELIVFAKALADETRQEIMKHLCCVWLNVSDIVEKLDGRVKQPSVSHHLRLLDEAHLVLKRRQGKHAYYTLNQEYFTVCCGKLVQDFAPDYTAYLLPVNEISADE